MAGRADCIFCRIARGEAPCHKVYEDELALAFMDLFPVADGHTLVVTRDHYDDLFEAGPEALAATAAAAGRVANAIRRTLAPDGLAVYQANGEAAGQTVFHYHLHLIPRAAGEPLKLHGRTRGDPDRLGALSASLREALRSA